MKFNIHQDLQSRPSDQQAEILAISGPGAAKRMKLLSEGNLSAFKELTGVDVSQQMATSIVRRYGKAIMGV